MEHRVVSGDKVVVDHPEGLPLPCTSFARWTVNGHNFEFGTGKADFAEMFARSLGVSSFDAEYSYEAGSLKIGTDEVVDQQLKLVAERTWAVWRGSSFSCFTQRIEKTRAQLVAAMSAFRIVEEEAGVYLVPRDGSARPLKSSGRPCVYKGIEGRGLVTIGPRSADSDRRIPPWAGKKVRGGELFRGSDTELTNGSYQRSLILVGRTATAELDIEVGSDDDAAVDAMSELVVTWAAA